MNSRINKNYLNVFFLIIIFFSVQWFSSHVYFSERTYNEKVTNTKQRLDSLSFEQINYSDNLEVDTTFELQKRKIFDIDNVDITNTSTIFTILFQNEINITFNTYFSNNLYKLSNPRAPPLT